MTEPTVEVDLGHDVEEQLDDEQAEKIMEFVEENMPDTERLTGPSQLSPIAGVTPDVSLFTVGGELFSPERELPMFRRVRVVVLDEDSAEEITSAHGYVGGVGPAEKAADGGKIIARVHKIKLG